MTGKLIFGVAAVVIVSFACGTFFSNSIKQFIGYEFNLEGSDRVLKNTDLEVSGQVLKNTDLGVAINEKPMIGILCQTMGPEILDIVPELYYNYSSYVAASYVKFIESAGARVVPIRLEKSEEYHRELFKSLNGLFIPGGNVNVFTSKFSQVSKLFFELAIEANRAGDVFPIWGTCLGFQLMAVLDVFDEVPRDVITSCTSNPQNAPLNLLDGWQNSRLFGQAPREIIRKVTTRPINLNFHHDCINRKNFDKYGLDKFWIPLSDNIDPTGNEYLSTIEARDFPFFAVQYHPEKNPYEWSNPSIPDVGHSRDAIDVSYYMGRFFVNYARHSNHTVPKGITEEELLIYNYHPLYTARMGIAFTQIYFFV